MSNFTELVFLKKLGDGFTLDERIREFATVTEDLELLIYKIGESLEDPTEDELINILIGIISLHKVRYERVRNTINEIAAEERKEKASQT
tara:strand:- start:5 stop:274 length:270 start_codon:yes stop_codon:yes gene_type:complete